MCAAISGPESSCRKCRPVTRCGPSACGSNCLKRGMNTDGVEHVVLASPDQQRGQSAGRQFAFQPGEALERLRGRVQWNPARPGPGQQATRSIRQHGFIRRLRALLKSLPVDHGQIDAARRQCVVPPEQIWPEQRRVHHPPGKYPRVKLGRRQRPGPGTHQHQRSHACGIRQRETQAGWAAPVVADQRGAPQIKARATVRSDWRCGHRGCGPVPRTGFSDRPKPIMSGMTTRYPAAVSGDTKSRYRKPHVGLPWSSTTGSPAPSST